MSYRNLVIDAYDDQCALFIKTFPYSQVPELVKTAADLSGDRDSLPAETFALVLVESDGEHLTHHRKFAMIDPGNTVLSVHYLHHVQSRLPPEATKVAAANLVVALRGYGMTPPDELVEMAKGAVAGDRLVLVRSDEATEKVASVRQDSLQRIQSDISRFQDGSFTNMEPVDRRHEALRLQKLASAVKLPSDCLQPWSGSAYGDQVLVSVRARKDLLEDKDDWALYEELLEKRSFVEPEKFAEALELLDRSLGMDYHWDGRVPDPYRSTFEKTAAKSPDNDGLIESPAGQILESDLISLVHTSNGRALVAEQFGEDFTAKFQKKPVVVFKSLPEPIRLILARMALSARHQ